MSGSIYKSATALNRFELILRKLKINHIVCLRAIWRLTPIPKKSIWKSRYNFYKTTDLEIKRQDYW